MNRIAISVISLILIGFSSCFISNIFLRLFAICVILQIAGMYAPFNILSSEEYKLIGIQVESNRRLNNIIDNDTLTIKKLEKNINDYEKQNQKENYFNSKYFSFLPDMWRMIDILDNLEKSSVPENESSYCITLIKDQETVHFFVNRSYITLAEMDTFKENNITYSICHKMLID